MRSCARRTMMLLAAFVGAAFAGAAPARDGLVSLQRIAIPEDVPAHAYATTEEASLTDPLTGLRNRRYLEQTIEPDLELSLRQRNDLVFFLLDLDHFKSAHDTDGHAAGDAVLVQLAEVLRATFRASDHLVRWSGEEFLVVARFIDRARAPELAEKIRAATAAHPFALPDGTVIQRTCSIGFAAWPRPGATWEQVVDAADAAL